MINRPIDHEYNIENESPRFSASFLNDLVEHHSKRVAHNYKHFQNLYEGKHRIKNRTQGENKPNNKLTNDFFGQTIDNTVGYFLGNPVIIPGCRS